MRISISVFAAAVLALSLGGCEAFVRPTFLPSGYTYHGQDYKAPPGPEARSIGYAYSERANEEALQVWRIVVGDLADQLAEQLGPVSEPIYISPLPQKNAFNASYDYVLREALAERGYLLATEPEDAALHLVYEAYIPKDATADEKPFYNGDLEKPAERKKPASYEEFILIMTAAHQDRRAAKVAGVYKLPPYGYQEQDSVDLNIPPLFEGVPGGMRE